MNTLTATYPDGAELTFDVPESWPELSKKQFAAVAPLLYQGDVLNLFTRFVYHVLGKKLFKQITSDANMDEFIHAFQFLTTLPVLETSYFKGFCAFGKRWCGVDDKLLDMSINDFGLCEGALNYLEHPLNKKIFYETIYNRGIFNFIPLSEKKKAALRLNYEALRAHVPTMYPGLKTSPDNKPPDYHAMIINISAGPFGDYEKTKKSLLHDVLKYLEQQAIKAAEETPAT